MKRKLGLRLDICIVHPLIELHLTLSVEIVPGSQPLSRSDPTPP